MDEIEEFFTIEEAAKWCRLKPRAMYMHYYRGHIRRVPDVDTWRVYFTRAEIDSFRQRYLRYD